MKRILYVLLLVCISAFGQGKHLTKSGTLTFEASVPSFEEVAAKNSSVTAILNTENGEFAALALVKAFRFKNALMEEHFNENYAESDEFPKAVFNGSLVDFDANNLQETYIVNGELTFHGETKNLKEVKVSFSKSENLITLKGNFKVLVSDFGIEIPKIVRNKLSEEVSVTFNFELHPK